MHVVVHGILVISATVAMAAGFVYLAWPGDPPEYVAPVCDAGAPPSLVVDVPNRVHVVDVASGLAAAGWVSIGTDSRARIVTADCHASRGWSP